MNGTIAVYAASKEYVSPEVIDEVLGVRSYVTALAAHDLRHVGNRYATAAFDLDHGVRDACGQPLGVCLFGLQDWQAFCGRCQMHVHVSPPCLVSSLVPF